MFISAAEVSGDRHAADLIAAIRQQHPSATFFGVAGPAMQAAGCEAIDDWTARATMLVGAVRLAGEAFRLVRRVGRLMRERRPDLAILVDSPALHLPMAKHIRPSGCPVLYYVAPQLWAWAPWRIRKVRRRVDRMAVILPFEEQYFRSRGVAADFVGHPLVSQLAAQTRRPEQVQELQDLGRPLVACLAGSRKHVVREVLPGQIEVARAITKAHPKAAFIFAAADDRTVGMIASALAGESFTHRIEMGRNTDVLSAADFALCASGTATLEVAWHGVPMAVMYNGSKWGYRLVGRWLITTPHLSLVNILAARRIIPEFMPYYTSTAPIIEEALAILVDPHRQSQMKTDLADVIRSLGKENAAARTAQIAIELAAAKRR